jgi:tRNA nucleotidyltransferase (CCA-adding enzyme)
MTKESKAIKLALPRVVFDIIEKLKTNGYEAYIVGGCLRDLILERPIND